MRKIIHVDMDCFYAAVEIKHRPELAGKPLAVGGPPDTRSVICTANYEARKFGVKAAIPSSRAVRLCPHLILIPPRFEIYKQESQAIRKVLNEYTDLIEPLSLDEAYLDVTEFCQNTKTELQSASLVAKEIRHKISTELKLNCSAGIAPNKFLAKVASDWRKPNNQFTIRPEEIEKFMPSLPVERVYGIGPVTKSHLQSFGIFTCGDLQKLSLFELQRIFGRRAQEMHGLCRGEDSRPVNPHRVRKSLTVEETYNQNLNNFEEIHRLLPGLFDDWSQRFERSKEEKKIKSWVVKIKYFDFKSTTHESASKTIPTLSDFETLMKNCYSKNLSPVRLLGLGVRFEEEEMVDSPQLLFF